VSYSSLRTSCREPVSLRQRVIGGTGNALNNSSSRHAQQHPERGPATTSSTAARGPTHWSAARRRHLRGRQRRHVVTENASEGVDTIRSNIRSPSVRLTNVETSPSPQRGDQCHWQGLDNRLSATTARTSRFRRRQRLPRRRRGRRHHDRRLGHDTYVVATPATCGDGGGRRRYRYGGQLHHVQPRLAVETSRT